MYRRVIHLRSITMNALTDTTELAADLSEINQQMLDLLHQAERLLRAAAGPDLPGGPRPTGWRTSRWR